VVEALLGMRVILAMVDDHRPRRRRHREVEGSGAIIEIDLVDDVEVDRVHLDVHQVGVDV
jgi:hypothetical protein